MLAAFKKVFDQIVSSESGGSAPEYSYDQAVVALMIEIMIADDQVDDREARLILDIIKKQGVDDALVDDMFHQAQSNVKDATDVFSFTNAINDKADAQMKEELMRGLWRVAFADNELSHYEDHMIRRISELLYVPHSVFIKTKLQVKGENKE